MYFLSTSAHSAAVGNLVKKENQFMKKWNAVCSCGECFGSRAFYPWPSSAWNLLVPHTSFTTISVCRTGGGSWGNNNKNIHYLFPQFPPPCSLRWCNVSCNLPCLITDHFTKETQLCYNVIQQFHFCKKKEKVGFQVIELGPLWCI